MKDMHLGTFQCFKRLTNSCGQTTAEMGLLLVPFMLLLFAVIEFGWYYFHQHSLQFAAREGMRMALVGGTLLDDEGDPMTREESVIKTIRDSAAWAMNIPEGDIWIFQVGDNYSNPEGWGNGRSQRGKPS